jgi:outer membrane protein assembly factor BamA
VESPARVGEPPGAPASRTGAYSRYENESIELATARLNARVDPDPEGKIIERIVILPLEVIEPRDPAPQLLNALHATTRPHVLEHEVLSGVGEPYSKAIVDETARNLRQRSQLSLVLCVALAGSDPGKVQLLVLTKDVWSLRLNWDAAYSSGGLERLSLVPTESNLLGTHQSVSLLFTLLPAAYSVGLGYGIPRINGSWWSASAQAGLIFRRSDGATEGSFGGAAIARPLFSTRTEWAFQAGAAFRDEIVRRYVGTRVGTFDAQATPGVNDAIPYQYRSNQVSGSTSVTRSYGWARKNDVTLGLEMSRRRYSTGPLTTYDPAAVAEFVSTRVPTSDNRTDPYVQWRTYSNDYLRVIDLETLALQEDFRLGHDVYVKLYPSLAGAGSSRTVLGVYAGAQYTVALGDGLARLVLESTTEREPDRLADASLEAAFRVVTPRLGFGRFLLDATMIDRYRNYLNRTTFLGGDGRLRGYPSNYLTGKDALASNLEFRTTPVEIFSCQLGGAVFYDTGDAFDSFAALRLKQSAGVGFRMLFPQLDRIVFRGDLGFPLARGGLPPGVSPLAFFVAFEQAFRTPIVGP